MTDQSEVEFLREKLKQVQEENRRLREVMSAAEVEMKKMLAELDAKIKEGLTPLQLELMKQFGEKP
jgi:predicted nuclease with TOPRIM domain